MLAHYLTALAIAVEGISRLDQGDRNWPFISLCWIVAATIVTVAALHHFAKFHSPGLEALSYLLEAIICASIAFLSFHEGKFLLPYAWLLAAIVCGGAAKLRFRRGKRPLRQET